MNKKNIVNPRLKRVLIVGISIIAVILIFNVNKNHLFFNNRALTPFFLTITFKVSDSIIWSEDLNRTILCDTIYLGKVETINLLKSYKIVFKLDPESVIKFKSFWVFIMIYEPSYSPEKSSPQAGSMVLFSNELIGPDTSSVILDRGKYNIYIKISYYAEIVEDIDFGLININISYNEV
ncbi:MAG: hypothetical protein ACFFDT_04475 [Candidatus Hodarchaeota archaeon]